MQKLRKDGITPWTKEKKAWDMDSQKHKAIGITSQKYKIFKL